MDCLPFAQVCTAVNMQHFPGNVWRFNQEHDRIHDFLSVRDASHGGERAEKILWLVLMQRRINDARRNDIKADPLFRIFHRQVFRDGLNAAFGKHRHRSRDSSNGVIDQRGSNAPQGTSPDTS
jgi:hypothetical protein